MTLEEKYKDVQPPLKFTELGGKLERALRVDFRMMADWDIPETVVIGVAPVGAFIGKDQNPNHPTTPNEIVEAFKESVERGAVALHVHARDEAGRPTAEAKYFHMIVDPIRELYGNQVVIDGGCMTGNTFMETMTPIIEGIYDIAIVNPTTGLLGDTVRAMLPRTIMAQAEFYREHGVKAMIDVHDASSIGNAKRYLIDTGLVDKPYMWHLLPGLPGTFYHDNVKHMVKGLLYLVEVIKDISEDSFIMVSEGGRAATYLTCFAMLLGLHVRVGMEDVLYKWPHKKVMVKSNAELVEEAVTIARALGRRPATSDEYRKMIGIG